MAKIVRFLLILTTIFTLSFYLPSLYRRTVEKRPLKTMIYFSEVSRDFVIARETVDSASQQGSMLYYDGRNNLLSETEYMQLLPFNNRRKLKLMGIMPDSLNGVELTTDVLKNVKRSMLIADRSFTYQIDPLFESEPERLGVTLPDDLFRIGKNGIEFIDCETGEIRKEKSERFEEAMRATGFEAPASGIYGIPSVIKRWDSGYFITDRNGRLFHLKMVKGAPFCRKIETGFDVKNIRCHTDILPPVRHRKQPLRPHDRLFLAPSSGRNSVGTMLHDIEQLFPHLQNDRERFEYSVRTRPLIPFRSPICRENRPLQRHSRGWVGEKAVFFLHDEDTRVCPFYSAVQPDTRFLARQRDMPIGLDCIETLSATFGDTTRKYRRRYCHSPLGSLRTDRRVDIS